MTASVKILDFGLAKALDPAAASDLGPEWANSPTITTPAMTQAGFILGTAAYMSPEQAKGRVVDKRARRVGVRLRVLRNVDGATSLRRRRRHRYDCRDRPRRAGLDGAAARHAAADSPAPEALPGKGSPRAHVGYQRRAVPDERADRVPGCGVDCAGGA